MSTQIVKKMMKRSKRGDTLIEVMFAIAVFSLVAVLSVSMMNLGLANSEGALELVTARNELNAQAEALRFIHSSYISERSLPKYGDLSSAERKTEKYRQYQEIWDKIVENAVESDEYSIEYPLNNCADVYTSNGGETLLQKNKAFVINTRDLSLGNPAQTGSTPGATTELIYIGSNEPENRNKFHQATLNARIIYSNKDGKEQNFENDNTSFGEGARNEDNLYNRVALVEGIWVVAVKGKKTTGNAVTGESKDAPYYDFYIETCWNPPNSIRPTSLDTVIRLYNPE